MSGEATKPAPGPRRLDQWLWFARLVKSRTLAARLCAGGEVRVNGGPVRKAGRPIRVGDTVALAQGPWLRTVRVVGLGLRRGPASEARLLYEEAVVPARRVQSARLPWVPLLADDPAEGGEGRRG